MRKLFVNVNSLFYPNYPKTQRWGATDYAIQEGGKVGICEKKRNVAADVNSEVQKESKKND